MAGRHGVGLIGCGNISTTYLRNVPLFANYEIRACASRTPEAARAQGTAFGVRAVPVDDLFLMEEIDTILNLTVPAAHFDVSMRALEAGKNVFTEKPVVLTGAEGREMAALAARRGLRVGSAPDTFLGGGHQRVRRMLDKGVVGAVTSATCFFQNPGMESWHPNPEFFFKPGGGPVLDLGPYYITCLVQLLGPVERVVALTGKGSAERVIASEPRRGQTIAVEVPTTVHALLAFRSGAQVTLCLSWDVWHHGHSFMELYGREGTIYAPNPDRFGGEVRVTAGRDPVEIAAAEHPFERVNDPRGFANYRGAGLADMVQAIGEGRSHRCSLELALHVFEVMEGIQRSGEDRAWVAMETVCERPAPLPAEAAATLLA